MYNRQRNQVKNHIVKLIHLIHGMNEKNVNVLMSEYQAMTKSNCAWYEYQIKPLVVEVCYDRLKELRQKRNAR